jgi:two-component system, sensor histidine kinase and response regulator
MPNKEVIANTHTERETAELYVVMICGLLLVVYKLSLHYANAIQEYFLRFTTIPVADLIANVLFVFVIMQLGVAHGRWRRSLARRREVEQVLASIRQEVIMTVGRDRTITMCNEAIQAMYGYAPQDIIGKTTDILYYDRRSSAPGDSVFDSLQNVGFHVGEATGRRMNGEEFMLEVVTGDLKGGPGAVVLLRDVTELKRMESMIRESETRYRRMFELSPEAIITISSAGIVTSVNARVTDWLGYDATEIIGLPLPTLPFLPDESRNTVVDMFKRRMSGEDVPPYDLNFVSKNGETRVGSILATPIMNDLGTPIEELVVISDVTLKRRAEDAIRCARDVAIESAQLKSQFLANMSHEIRTPMNGIITVAQLALGTQLTPEQQGYLETIADSSRTLLRIINDILDFSKVEAGKLEFQEEPFALRDVIADVLRPHALHAGVKDVEVVASIEPSLPDMLVGDATRLNQILTNLVGNAVKFTANGEILTTATLDAETDETIVLRVEVADTGIGIPADRVNSIFEAFSQADASTSRQYGGTGLGLAICSHLVDMLHGKIGVKSTEGEGSMFWFTARFEKQNGAAPAEGKNETLSCRVLIATPHESLCHSLAQQLGAWNCPHAEAATAATALRAIQAAKSENTPFDILLADAAIFKDDSGGQLKQHVLDAADTHPLRLVEVVPLAEFEQHRPQTNAARIARPVRASDLYNTLLSVLGRASLRTHPHPPRGFRPDQIAPPEGRQWRILLAEDNATNQKVALAILKKAGLAADVVINGKEAIAALSERDYDVVLMDLQMPVMDGFEAMRHIRNADSSVRNHDIPAVAMTAHAMKGDRQRCLDAGMTDYVSKPVDPHALIEALVRMLNDSPSPTDSRTRNSGTAAATAADTATPLFDRATALGRMGGDEDLLKELLEIFREDVAQQLRDLTAAVTNGDAKGTQLHAHSIKGAAGNVAANRIQALAQTLECVGKDADFTNAGDALAQLTAAIEEFRKAV